MGARRSSAQPPRARAAATLALGHALRTPLTSLSLGLGLLRDGSLGDLTEAQRDVVRSLVAEAARLSLLVDRALDTDRLGVHAGPIEREIVDLGALVEQAVRPIVEQAREQGVRVEASLPAGVMVVADPAKLAWVATTLLGNALRYSPPGARIEVRVAAANDGAELTVRDGGPGIAPERARGIFARDAGGGLFLLREIVEAHGGEVRLRSAPGPGAAFTVTLPAGRRSEVT